MGRGKVKECGLPLMGISLLGIIKKTLSRDTDKCIGGLETSIRVAS